MLKCLKLCVRKIVTIPDRVKNYTGRAARLISPIYDPSEVVRTILYASEQPIRDIYVGGVAPILNFFSKLMPNVRPLA